MPRESQAREGQETAVPVGKFAREIRLTLETTLGAVWVLGEVSNLRRQNSGHTYFTLKDADGQLAVVAFRGTPGADALQEGAAILVWGEVSVYEARGQLQLVARYLTPTGTGKLQEAFERLKRQLDAEGLFDDDRKQPLPTLPRRIALITSPTGAAVRDFTGVLERLGFTGLVRLFPVRVQGEEAKGEIVRAMQQAHEVGGFDVLVLARGGGSLEDLWAFNEEPVVRAVAAARIPTISAIGHAIDFALTDFAADFRAETPTAAAETLAHRQHLAREAVTELRDRLRAAMQVRFDRLRESQQQLARRLQQTRPERLLEQLRQRLDDLADRRQRSADSLLTSRRENLRSLAKRLASVGPESVLRRGFAIVRDSEGYVTSAKAAKTRPILDLTFADGSVPVTPTGIRKTPRRRTERGSESQDELAL